MNRTSSWLMRRSARDMARAPFSVKVLSFIFKILHNRTQILVSRGTQVSLSDPDPDWIRVRILNPNPDPKGQNEFLVIKTLDTDWIRIGTVFSLKCWIRIKWTRIQNAHAQLRIFVRVQMQQGPPLLFPRQLPETRDFETRKNIYNKSVLKENQRRAQDAM